MTIYVDAIFTATPRTTAAKRHGNQWCHMMASKDDDIEELHQMAELIGLKRSYFQPHRLYPHYDLTPAKRAKAVANGAVEVNNQEKRLLCKRMYVG
jgi:hypothetical protein